MYIEFQDLEILYSSLFQINIYKAQKWNKLEIPEEYFEDVMKM